MVSDNAAIVAARFREGNDVGKREILFEDKRPSTTRTAGSGCRRQAERADGREKGTIPRGEFLAAGDGGGEGRRYAKKQEKHAGISTYAAEAGKTDFAQAHPPQVTGGSFRGVGLLGSVGGGGCVS